nr:PREDICTED: zinc finger and BTB domain-containing protein 40 isoform X2 [Latimeria chalumnae]|eukprot:XP_014344781.1 PREDICTED: zinc finger and BTB domain-containing protein 40 isoform X2 [Latimeria chalumnae]
MELPSYSKQLILQLHTLRKENQFCDCTIMIGTCQFRAHKVVLGASSLLFKSLLEGTDIISIDSSVISSEEFNILLEMVYTGRLPPGKHNLTKVISIADSLQMFDVAVSCKNVLANLISRPPQVQSRAPALVHLQEGNSAQCAVGTETQPPGPLEECDNFPQVMSLFSHVAASPFPPEARNSTDAGNVVSITKKAIADSVEELKEASKEPELQSTSLSAGSTDVPQGLNSDLAGPKGEENKREEPPIKKRRVSLSDVTSGQMGKELEFLLHYQTDLAEALTDASDILDRVEKSGELSSLEKQVFADCCTGGKSSNLFFRLLEKVKKEAGSWPRTLLSLLEQCRDSYPRINAVLQKRPLTEEPEGAKDGGSLFALLLQQQAELLNSVTELSPIIECLHTAEEDFITSREKELILECCKGRSTQDAVEKLIQKVEREGCLSAESLVKLLQAVKEAFPDLQRLLERLEGGSGSESEGTSNLGGGFFSQGGSTLEECGFNLLRRYQEDIAAILTDPKLLLTHLAVTGDISTAEKQVMQTILQMKKDGGGIGAVMSAAVEAHSLSALTVWRTLLGLVEKAPALGMLLEEIRQEPLAEQLLRSVLDKETRAVELVIRHRELISDSIDDIRVLLESLAAGLGLQAASIEVLKTCCDRENPRNSMKNILGKVLEEQSVPALEVCRLFFSLRKAYPKLESMVQEMEQTDLLQETPVIFSDAERERQVKKWKVNTEDKTVQADEEGSNDSEKDEKEPRAAGEAKQKKSQWKGGRKKLSSKQSYVCKTCNKSFNFKCRLDVHLKRCPVANQKSVRCSECGETLASKKHLEKHWYELHTSNSKEKKKHPPVTCDICGKGFSHPSGMQYHKRTDHFDEKPFSCKDCGAKFAANSTLKNHMRLHTGERPYFCKHCDMTFTQAAALAYHTKKKHSEGKMYGCQYCEAVFAQSIELTRHVRTHTGDKPYVCRECGKGFSQASGLSMHLRTLHNIEDSFDCQKCQMSFTTVEEHRKHVQESHPREYHPCNTCGKIFSAPSLLERHVVTHVGGKPYNCEICGKAYQQLSGLWYHNRTHHPAVFAVQNHRSAKFSSLKCPSCDLTFSSASLGKHIKTQHTDLKMHECQQCQEVFLDVSLLQVHHKLKHADLKMHECQQCQEVFLDVSLLQVHHKLKHAGPQPFKCLYCSATFCYPSALQHHVSMEHFNQEENSYGCGVCGELFTSPKGLDEHYQKEHADVVLTEAQGLAAHTVQVIQTSEKVGSGEHVITLDESQVFVTLPDPQSSVTGPELVAVNMEDLLDGTVTLICGETQ